MRSREYGYRPKRELRFSLSTRLLVFPSRLLPFSPSLSGSLRLSGLLLLLFSISPAQRVAIITPEKSPQTNGYSLGLAEKLGEKIRVLDPGMSESGYRSTGIETPFNLSASESKRLASVLGCDLLLIIRTGIQRRMSFSKDDYFEAFAVSYLVSGRTGRLVDWRLNSFEAESADKAEGLLAKSIEARADKVIRAAASAINEELTQKPVSVLEEVPAEGSPGTKNFRPPVPYKRIKPDYTKIAYLYDARATVEIEVDIDADGTILRTDIVRWAGYGLDESVTDVVRKMNWRPAERNGKPLPMRVLLRYNFTKVEKTDPD